MTALLLARATTLVLGLGGMSGCDAMPPPQDWWDDGSGGTASVPTLTSLDVADRNCDLDHVSDMTCEFVDGGVLVRVAREHDPTDPVTNLLVAFVEGTALGAGVTPAAGYVRLTFGSCYHGESTAGAPDPCELELQGIERGEVREMSTGSGGDVSAGMVEVGSRVRIRVSCPDGLYYPGTVDVNPFVLQIVPTEFALEAQDCLVVDE